MLIGRYLWLLRLLLIFNDLAICLPMDPFVLMRGIVLVLCVVRRVYCELVLRLLGSKWLVLK
jgi:hypothetical protein